LFYFSTIALSGNQGVYEPEKALKFAVTACISMVIKIAFILELIWIWKYVNNAYEVSQKRKL